MKNLQLWMCAKSLVVGALLLLGSSAAVLVAGDGDCNEDKNPSKLPKFFFEYRLDSRHSCICMHMHGRVY